MKKLLIGADHAAFPLKETLKAHLMASGYAIVDVGTHSAESVDYPDIAASLCEKIPVEATQGILLCGSGIGISIAANRFPHIRAALCHDNLSAKLSRLHNDANVLVMGARLIGEETAKDCVEVFLNTAFAGGERHERRIEKLKGC
jgi:ribose 5-phosphate isomerase B